MSCVIEPDCGILALILAFTILYHTILYHAILCYTILEYDPPFRKQVFGFKQAKRCRGLRSCNLGTSLRNLWFCMGFLTRILLFWGLRRGFLIRFLHYERWLRKVIVGRTQVEGMQRFMGGRGCQAPAARCGKGEHETQEKEDID